MNIIIVKLLSYHLLVRNLLHNLHKRKTTYLLLLNKLTEKRLALNKILSNNKAYGCIEKIMAFNNTPAAHDIKGGGDIRDSSPCRSNLPYLCAGIPQPGTSRSGQKESNSVKDYQMHEMDFNQISYVYEYNPLYTTLTCTPNSGLLHFNRSLPDHSSLQNVYLLREDNEFKTIQRPYSTGDVRTHQGKSLIDLKGKATLDINNM